MWNLIYMAMPIGLNFGWGFCGKYLTLEMCKLADVVFITEEFTLKRYRGS
jgi:hypothetical protein